MDSSFQSPDASSARQPANYTAQLASFSFSMREIIAQVIALAIVVLSCVLIHKAPNCSPNIIWSIIGLEGADKLISIVDNIKDVAQGQLTRSKALLTIAGLCLMSLSILTLQGVIAQKTFGWIYVGICIPCWSLPACALCLHLIRGGKVECNLRR